MCFSRWHTIDRWLCPPHGQEPHGPVRQATVVSVTVLITPKSHKRTRRQGIKIEASMEYISSALAGDTVCTTRSNHPLKQDTSIRTAKRSSTTSKKPLLVSQNRNPCFYPCRPIFITLRADAVTRGNRTRSEASWGRGEPVNDSCCWFVSSVARQSKKSCWSEPTCALIEGV